MPYTTKKVGSKTCVYKKDGGAKVGCTSGPVSKYLGALHANANENKEIDGDIPEKGKFSIKTTDQDLTITRWCGDVLSKSTFHLGHKPTQDEIREYTKSIIKGDASIGKAFKQRFGLEERQKLKEALKIIKSTIIEVINESNQTSV